MTVESAPELEVLDAWEALAAAEVALPSGMRAKVVPGSLTDLMVRGVFPQPLMEAVLAGASDTISDTDASARGFELMRETTEVAAAAIKALEHDGRWIPVTVDVERFGRLPAADRQEVIRVAVGEELAEVLAGLATFRDDSGGADAGDDGGAVRPAAVDTHGPNRATRRRARSRSGARG